MASRVDNSGAYDIRSRMPVPAQQGGTAAVGTAIDTVTLIAIRRYSL